VTLMVLLILSLTIAASSATILSFALDLRDRWCGRYRPRHARSAKVAVMNANTASASVAIAVRMVAPSRDMREG
jgi:hypothetical protein